MTTPNVYLHSKIMQQFSPGGFRVTPPVVKNIIAINVIMFLITIVTSRAGIDIYKWLALHSIGAVDASGHQLFKPWQLITHMFLHGGGLMDNPNGFEGGIMHLFSNMLGLWIFGSVLEQIWGSKRFINFYLICGIAAAIAQLGVYYFTTADHSVDYSCVGASGAIFGILGTFAYLFPNTVLLLGFMFPIKAKYAIALYAAYEIFGGWRNAASDNIAHAAHLGGLAAGVLIVIFWNKTQKRNFY